MPRNPELLARLYNRTPEESKTGAKLNNARLQDENQSMSENFSNRIQTNISNRVDDFTRKQALQRARQIDDIKEIAKNDQFVEDAETFRSIVQGNKLKAPLKAIKLALTSRKAVKDHKKHAWTMPFVVALAMDGIISIISAAISTVLPIPVFSPGKLMLLCGWIYLLIFLWGTGAQLKARIIGLVFACIEVFIPFVSLLPLSTLAVYMAYRKSEKKYMKGKAHQEEFSQQYPGVSIEQA